MEHVKGVKKAKVMLYALSTCVWCLKTKALLDELRVDYNYIDVDLTEGVEKEAVKKKLKRWNPKMSFPTLVLDNRKCIVGFDEESIRGNLK